MDYIILTGFICIGVYANIIFYKDKKNGILTKEGLEELEETMKIW